jgi:hypothetical protein
MMAGALPQTLPTRFSEEPKEQRMIKKDGVRC